jgi:signal transduction histidine kinase
MVAQLLRGRCLLAVSVALCAAEVVWAAEQKQVLALYSTGREAQIAATGERELPRILDRGLARNLDYYSEYLDAGRIADPQYQEGFRDFLALKYRGRRFDVVLAMLDVSIEFLGRYREELFPGTPVVFFALRPIERRIPNSTGVIGQVDFGGTVTLATTLQPDTREIVVVSGASSRDREFESEARRQLALFEPRLTITYLAGLPTSELERRLSTLAPHAVVYYLLVYEDGVGRNFQPLDYLERLAAVSNRPIYSWVDSTLGRGALGGSMQRLDAQVDAAAELALRVLRGEAADSIPISSPNLNVGQVDWRQLRRWGISEARIPDGVHVLFREPGLWQRYRTYIVVALAVLLAQTVLIAGLLVQAGRRRQAEARARASETKLRRSFERIRALGRRLLSEQEGERSRIARELHDDVSQQIALLTFNLQLLSGEGPSRPNDSLPLAREALDHAYGIARSVHDLSHRLHPAKLRLIGLVPSLESLEREFSRADLAVSVTHDGVPPDIPFDVTLCVFRIVQEALRNAAKHSAASIAKVHLGSDESGLLLTIADDGVGFDVEAVSRDGLGLVSMSERLEPLGGTLKIESRPGQGTRLEVRLPHAHPIDTVAV